MPAKLTTEQFIKKAQEVHGDLYDYSQVHYINSRTKVLIIHPVHGEHWFTPTSHLRGCGHPKVGNENSMNKRSSNTEQFIIKAQEVHGDLYDYSQVHYINSRTKVLIIHPVHGDHWIRPTDHLSGCGHPKVGNENSMNKRSSNTEQFIIKAQEVHGDLYDYSKVQYINAYTKVLIIHPVHGEYWIRPGDHLSGRGHSKAGNENSINKRSSNTEQFIIKAQEVHGDLYDYRNVQYVNCSTKVLIIHPVHGEHWITPTSHLSGCGHPSAAQSGFNYNIPGYFYIHKVFNNFIHKGYKLGITNYNEKRFARQYNKNYYKPQKHKAFWCINGSHVYSLESYLINKYKDILSYFTKNNYKDGFTETFCVGNYQYIIKSIYDYIEKHNSDYPDEQIIELELVDGEFKELVLEVSS